MNAQILEMITERHPRVGEHVFGIGLFLEFEHRTAEDIRRPSGGKLLFRSILSGSPRSLKLSVRESPGNGLRIPTPGADATRLALMTALLPDKLRRLCGREVLFLRPDPGFSCPAALRIT